MKYILSLLLILAGCSNTEKVDSGRLNMGDWFIFEPEPGIHCVSVKRGLGSSVDCYPAPVREEQDHG